MERRASIVELRWLVKDGGQEVSGLTCNLPPSGYNAP